MEFLLGSIAVIWVASGMHGWFSDKSTKLRDDEHNRHLRQLLEDQKREQEMRHTKAGADLTSRAKYLDERSAAFAKGILNGRKWLAHFIAEANRAFDESIATELRVKKRPALKAAEEVSAARAERRAALERVRLLEYQLKSLKEYFPLLEDYEEAILDEALDLKSGGENVQTLEDADPVLRFLPREDYERLTPAERNQRALNRYLDGSLGPAAIGRLYERYLGFLYERDGWEVNYHGIFEGFEDLGRDLICKRGDDVEIVQAKCWSQEKTIREKHILQLYGTTQLYLMRVAQNKTRPARTKAVFVTSTALSAVAKEVAEWLRLEVREGVPLDKSYPMIKCNIGQANNERIYHLPFDQQYDRTRITPSRGEFYARTTAEAEARGFRRAFRYRPAV